MFSPLFGHRCSSSDGRLFQICKNHAVHLRGNVYVQYQNVDDAIKAFSAFSGRFYAGKQLTPEFVPIVKWKAAVCGLYDRRKCPRGKDCNFLHVFRNPGDEFSQLDKEETSEQTNRTSIKESDERIYQRSRDNDDQRLEGERHHQRHSSYHSQTFYHGDDSRKSEKEDAYRGRNEERFEDDGEDDEDSRDPEHRHHYHYDRRSHHHHHHHPSHPQHRHYHSHSHSHHGSEERDGRDTTEESKHRGDSRSKRSRDKEHHRHRHAHSSSDDDSDRPVDKNRREKRRKKRSLSIDKNSPEKDTENDARADSDKDAALKSTSSPAKVPVTETAVIQVM